MNFWKIKIVNKLFGRCLEAAAKFEWKRQPTRIPPVNFQGEEKIAESFPIGGKDNHSNVFIESGISPIDYGSSPSNEKLIKKLFSKGDSREIKLQGQDNKNKVNLGMNKNQSEYLQLESFNENGSENWHMYAEKSIGLSKEFHGESFSMLSPNRDSKIVHMSPKMDYLIPYSPKEGFNDSYEIQEAGDHPRQIIYKGSTFSGMDSLIVINIRQPEKEEQHDSNLGTIILKHGTLESVDLNDKEISPFRKEQLENSLLEIKENHKEEDDKLGKQFEELEHSKEMDNTDLFRLGKEEIDKREEKMGFKDLKESHHEINEEGETMRSSLLKKKYPNNNKKDEESYKISKHFEDEHNENVLISEEDHYKVEDEPNINDLKNKRNI